MLRIIWNLWIYSIISQFFLVFALSARSENNDAEAILEKAIRDFRARIVANQRNESHESVDPSQEVSIQHPTRADGRFWGVPELSDSSDGEAINFVVHANENFDETQKRAKFEFLPHFEKEFYEFMVPEGLNREDFLVAIVDFIGLSKTGIPHFRIDSDPMGLFVAGIANTVQRPDHIQSQIPILLKKGAFVDSSKVPNNIYIFKITAIQHNHITTANMRAEIMRFMKRIDPIANETTAIDIPHIESENSIEEVWSSTVKAEEPSKHAMTTFTVNEPEKESLIVTRSVTEEDEFKSTANLELNAQDDMNIVTNDRDVNKTTIISANVTGNIGTENDLFIRTKSKGSSDSGIHLRGLIKHENESNMKILKAMEETGIPKEFVDEMTLIDPVLALETLEGLKTNETELMDPMDEPLKDSEFIAALEEANSKEGTSSMPDITVSIPIEFDTAITVEPNYKNSGELSKLESEGLENKEKAGKNITVHGNVSRPHVDDPQEGAAAPHDLASPLANGMPAETLIDNIQVVENSARLNVESNSGPGLDQDLNQNENVQNLMSDEPKSVEWSTAEPIEFLQDQAPENFSSHGIKIELTQQNNGPIQIPPYAEPGQSIDGIFAKIVAASNFTANEMFESQINPPGILDVRPHFAYPGQKMEIIVLEPTVFQRSTAAGRSLKFTLECTYANHDLRAQLPTGIVARRAFDAVQAAVAVGNTVTVGGGGGQFDAKRYTFHVSENAQNNAKIGKILVIGYSENKTENIQYGLLGNGAQHFKIDENGEITVTCQQAMICLDSETAPEYSITAVAKENASTITVPVTIHVDDLNDNLPKLKVFEKEIHVVDNEIEEPYFIMINDADISFQNRRNALELDGSASEFLVADHVVERDLHDAGASDGKHERIASYSPLWQIKIAAAAEPGVYTLVVRARQKDATITINNSSETTVNTSEATDNIVTAREDNAEITVIVKGESKKIRFGKTVYERTITSERLNKGNPLVQLDLKEAPENGGTVSFVILDRNPGWLAIESYGGHVYVGDVPRQSIKDGTYIATVGVLDQDTKKILAKCQVSITVIGTRQNEFILHKSLYSIVSARDGGLQTFAIPEILPENSALKIVEDTVRVYDSNSRRVRATENFVVMINNRNEVVLRAVDTIHEADFLHNVEQIVFQIQNVENERDKALVSIALSARVHDVVRRLHELSRPKFAAPWIDEATLIKIRLPEELPENYLVLRLPAYNPFNGRVIENFTLAGESAKYFRVDSVTASIKIHRRIDFEALSPAEQKSLSFELRAHNSAQDEAIFAEYDAVDDFNNSKDTSGTLARIDMQIFDVDDASPRIKVIELTDDENHTQIGNTPANRTQAGNTVANLIQISEGVRPGHMLARLSAHDADSQARKLKFALTSGSPTALKNFRIQQSNDTFYEITVSNEAKLDRETENCFELVASCMDPAGNRDQVPFVVELLDENDNRPLFTVQSLDVNVIDNWPRDVALMRFEAHDRDAGENARVSYSLLVEDKAAENFFAIDETTGVLRTARTLTELASEHDYALSVLASDNGVAPHFFSSTRVLVHVHDATRAADFEDAELRFVQPAISFVLELQEDTPIGRNVLKMEAIIGKMAQKNLMPVNYSIKPLNSSSDSTEWFRVDETTGELYTAAALDYERHKMITDHKTSTEELFHESENSRDRNQNGEELYDDSNYYDEHEFLYGEGKNDNDYISNVTQVMASDHQKHTQNGRVNYEYDIEKNGIEGVQRDYREDDGHFYSNSGENTINEMHLVGKEAQELQQTREIQKIQEAPLDENDYDIKNEWSNDLRVLEQSLIESIKKRAAAASAQRVNRPDSIFIAKNKLHTSRATIAEEPNRPIRSPYDQNRDDKVDVPYLSLRNLSRVQELPNFRLLLDSAKINANSTRDDELENYFDETTVNYARLRQKSKNRYGGYIPPDLKLKNRDSIGLDEANPIRKHSDEFSRNEIAGDAFVTVALESGYSSNENGTDGAGVEVGGAFRTTDDDLTRSPTPTTPVAIFERIFAAEEVKKNGVEDRQYLVQDHQYFLHLNRDHMKPIRVEISENGHADVTLASASKSPKKSLKGISSLKIFKIFSPSHLSPTKDSDREKQPSKGLVISPRLKRRSKTSKAAKNTYKSRNKHLAKSLQMLATGEDSNMGSPARDRSEPRSRKRQRTKHFGHWFGERSNWIVGFGDSNESMGAEASSRNSLSRSNAEISLRKSNNSTIDLIKSEPNLSQLGQLTLSSSKMALVTSAVEFLQNRIKETKYVTAVFESSRNGIAPILTDIVKEFRHWLGPASRLLAVACEVHWSVPEQFRSRVIEIKMKDSLHRVLRDNNRRVLNVYDECRRGLPASFIESKIEESCSRDASIGAFQGIYRRYYPNLLALQDPRTVVSHRSHWTLEALCEERRAPLMPAPAKFLQRASFSGAQLARKSIVAINMATLRLEGDQTNYDLEMVARRANASNVEARQLLRVRILNVDDHLPYFLQSSTEVSTLTFIWDDLANRDTIIGQVFAVDEDDTPFNDIYYYLLPSNPQAKKTFEIDEKSGEIRSIRGNDAIVGISPSAFHLYVFASSIKIADEKNLPHFNATRYDHLAVDVVAVSEKRRAHLTTRANLARLLENDTVVAVERSLKSQRIPITVYDAMRNSPFVYLLEDVEFIPWRNLNEFPSEDFIGIDASIGALRVDPLIAHSHLEGAFVATVRVQHAQSEITVAKIRKQVHILARESQLRFIIDEPAMVFALKMAAFKSNFESAISKNSPAKKFVAQLLAPEPHARLMNRSSVCFYFLNETTSNIADVFVPSSVSFQQLSIAENRELNRIYQLFRIVNVENCTSIADDVTSSNAIGAASTVTDDISHELLFWICALGFGILFLMTLCGYGIFIVRYREHLREKLAAEFDAPNKKIVEVQTCPIDVADYYCDGRFSTFFAPHLYDKQ